MIRVLTIAVLAALFSFTFAATGHADSKTDKKKAKPKEDVKKDKPKSDVPLEALADKRAKAIKALDDFAKGEEAKQIALIRERLASPDVDASERRALIAQHNKLIAAYNASLPDINANAQKSAEAYNAQGVAAYNKLVAKLNQDVAEYNRVVEKYNSTAKTPTTPPKKKKKDKS
jgi:uncharacterized protein YukE